MRLKYNTLNSGVIQSTKSRKPFKCRKEIETLLPIGTALIESRGTILFNDQIEKHRLGEERVKISLTVIQVKCLYIKFRIVLDGGK